MTKDHRYLDAAREKVQLGIYPGQLKSGPQAGRWFDPHNARLVYHFILLRGLAAYTLVMAVSFRIKWHGFCRIICRAFYRIICHYASLSAFWALVR